MQLAGKVPVGLAACPERDVAVVAESPGDGRATFIPAVPTRKKKSSLKFPARTNFRVVPVAR